MHTNYSLPHDSMLPTDRRAPVEARPRFTTSEFLQLGLFRVAYVTRVCGHDGATDVVLHGADGMAVAVVENGGLASELAEQLGLTLVSVH
jgi:hypothetical protein